jgi:predicted HTH transcriptional regulator
MKNFTEIPKEENQYIEFKSEAVKAMDLAKEIVAFANSEGGEIWLGVEDDGALSGLTRSYEEDVMGDLVEIDRARVTDLDLGKIGNYFQVLFPPLT